MTGEHLRCTGEGIANEDNGPDAMFSLAAMKGAKAAQKVAEAAVPDNAEAAAESSSESSGSDDGGSSSDEDSDDARRWGPLQSLMPNSVVSALCFSDVGEEGCSIDT